jgi:hypothetical protein
VSLALKLPVIQSLEGFSEAIYGLPDDPLNGQDAFNNKGYMECHSILGGGGGIGASLGDGGFNHSLIQI